MPNCPTKLTRTLKRGMRGSDVLGIKYGLRKAGFGRGLVFNNRYGLGVVNNVKRLQRARGLHVDGQIGPKTWAALRPQMPPYGCWLVNHYKPVAPVGVADLVVKEALYLAAHAASIHYTQSSLRWQGIDNRIKPPSFPRYADCSSMATYCYWVAGGPDPNNLGFRAGYTGTMVNHGWRVSVPRAGDLCFYGWQSRGVPEHVAVYIGGGRVVSHGSESGPLNLPLHYRGDLVQIRRYV